ELQEITENRLPDPIADAFRLLGREVESIEKRLAEIERREGIHAELDRFLKEKKQEIMCMFTPEEDFSIGAGI
ncbi:MAG TPA: hypothetical protein VJ373_05055, partial [Desulfatiglandales bacterium]|nr:hypothetical protein [Desulfatiglandales bacterium]